jgi:hypothetical protein
MRLITHKNGAPKDPKLKRINKHGEEAQKALENSTKKLTTKAKSPSTRLQVQK